MSVDDVYRILRFIVRKNQLGSLSPQDFQDAFNTAQRNYYDFLVGRVEQYRYDSPKPRVGLAMTDNVVSRLMPFQVSATATATTSGNHSTVDKPTEFNKLLSMYTPNMYRIYRIEQNRLAERIQDSIDPIDEMNAFYVEESTQWMVYPNATKIPSVTLKYLKVPVNVVWGYTLDGQGRPVYNPSTSVQPVWNENDYDELIGRAAKLVGVSFKEQADVQFGQSVINTGE